MSETTWSGNVQQPAWHGPDTGHLRERIAARQSEIAAAAQRPATPAQPVQRASVLDAAARAKLLAYQTGLKPAVHFFEAMYALLDEVVFLRSRVEALEATARESDPPHLAAVEKRTTKVRA